MSNRTRNKEVKIFFNDDEFNKLTDDVNGKIKCRNSVNLNVGFPTFFM